MALWRFSHFYPLKINPFLDFWSAISQIFTTIHDHTICSLRNARYLGWFEILITMDSDVFKRSASWKTTGLRKK